MEHLVSDWLINVWAVILTLILFMYVALDGFDLGVGMLSLLERDAHKKSIMMHCLSGVWDANETWLVLLGGTLFGAFPLAYSGILQSLYIPVMLMLFALMFRGVAFEFYAYSKSPALWLLAFGVGSLLVVLAQGLALGALLSGLSLDSTQLFGWFTPLSLITVAFLIAAYSLLGASYLFGKVEPLKNLAIAWAIRASLLLPVVLIGLLLFIAVNSPLVSERWLQHPFYFGLLLLIILTLFVLLQQNLRQQPSAKPFILCLISLFMVLIGLVSSHYPYLIPNVMTLHAAASSTKTLEFMLYAEGGLLPLMLIYNGYQYYVFRGRVTEHAE